MTTTPMYFTLASYVAALETHGATVGDIPTMIARLREASDHLEAALAECRRLREVVLRQSGALTEQQIAACMEVP